MSARFLSPDQRAAAARVFDSKARCFTDLVQAAGLDPARDLRGKALRCIVVQPDEDLTGHDFGGSDLTGAVFRRVDLSAVRLQDASLYAADLRGATLPKLGLCADQREQALTGALPPALRQGPNRLWPAHLIDAINEILTECGDDDELSFAARPRFREGSYGLAEHLFRTLLDWQNIVLEDDHERTLVTRHMLARAILDQGRYQEAEEMFRALLPVEERVLGSESKNTLVTRHALAQAILDQARAQEAEEMLRVLLPVEERVLGSENENTHVTRHNLAITILFQGRTREAEEMLRALLNLEENNVGAEKDSALVTRRNLALALLEQQATEEAAAILAKVPANVDYTTLRNSALSHLAHAFLADCQQNAERAEGHLRAAEEKLTDLELSHYARRMLECYLNTRTPGEPGGTVLWCAVGRETGQASSSRTDIPPA